MCCFKPNHVNLFLYSFSRFYWAVNELESLNDRWETISIGWYHVSGWKSDWNVQWWCHESLEHSPKHWYVLNCSTLYLLHVCVMVEYMCHDQLLNFTSAFERCWACCLSYRLNLVTLNQQWNLNSVLYNGWQFDPLVFEIFSKFLT